MRSLSLTGNRDSLLEPCGFCFARPSGKGDAACVSSRSILFVSALALLAACQGEKQLSLVTDAEQKTIPLRELLTRFGGTETEVEDHYLKRRVRYRAIPLAAMLRSLSASAGAYDEIVFRCADGYLAQASRAELESGRLDSFFLAYGEGGDKFQSNILQGKAEVSPEPFYVVSTDPAAYHTLSWPYEVVAIEFISFRQKFPHLVIGVLETDKTLKAGFDLFRKECLRCHSLNLEGGDVGPELNVPRNITEYRESKLLRAFIRDASAFRARSKMPPFTHLSAAQLEQIIAYLKVMRLYKTGQPKMH